MYMHTCIYTNVSTYTCMCIYIYIYIQHIMYTSLSISPLFYLYSISLYSISLFYISILSLYYIMYTSLSVYLSRGEVPRNSDAG